MAFRIVVIEDGALPQNFSLQENDFRIAGSIAQALDLIETIRQRGHALSTGGSSGTGTSQSPSATDVEGILNYLLEERAREFAFEGKRWYDVLRFAKRNNYQRLNILLEMVSRTVPGSLQQSAIAKFRDQNSHYLPIYQYELQTDKNLVQNPFYK